MMKVKDLLKGFDFTMDEFWAVVDSLPDEMNGKKHKANIRSYFKKDGLPKVKANQIKTAKAGELPANAYQDWHDTHGFIRRTVRRQIHMNRLRHHREVHIQHNKDVKDGKTERMRVEPYGKLVPFEKRGDE
jgi:hypothetical protein